MPRRSEAFGHSRNRRRKSRVKSILLKRDTAALMEWADEEKTAFRTLQSLLWDSDLLIVWRTIEAIGEVARTRTGRHLEEVREAIRKLLWCMNDESGNLCWFAGEAIAEILTHMPAIRKEYLLVWLGFLDEEPFEAGVRWGMVRLARDGSLSDDELQMLKDKRHALVISLDADKTAIRAMSVLALTAIGEEIPSVARKTLSEDTEKLNVYDTSTGELRLAEVRSLLP
ncbi:hypothetical protein KQH82_01925 [bacterium]|nr:hypothetical protein [bacterium]